MKKHNSIKVWDNFFSPEDKINIIQLEDGSFWFQFSHLAKILGYKNPTVTLQTHCEDYERQKLDIGQHEDINFVSESGFYSLVLGSKKPQAKKFKKWICSDFLPKLRAEGGYITETATPQQLEALKGRISKLERRQLNLLHYHCFGCYRNVGVRKTVSMTKLFNQITTYFEICNGTDIGLNFPKQRKAQIIDSYNRSTPGIPIIPNFGFCHTDNFELFIQCLIENYYVEGIGGTGESKKLAELFGTN